MGLAAHPKIMKGFAVGVPTPMDGARCAPCQAQARRLCYQVNRTFQKNRTSLSLQPFQGGRGEGRDLPLLPRVILR